MSITDELREWWVCKFPVMDSELHKDFRAIADRIDAEHERTVGFCKRLEDAAAKREDVEIFGVEYTALPLDADGEPIHAGDTLDGYGKTIEVVELRYGRSGWVLISRDGNGYADTFAFAHHAPTVEDVLREFAYGLGVPVADSYVAATATKLRLAGDVE